MTLTNRFFFWMFLFIISLLFFDITTYFFVENKLVIHFFQLATEKNLPTIFSTLQLLLSGFILHFIARQKNSSNSLTHYWLGLSYIFYFLAFDEWITVHDWIGYSVGKNLGVFGDIFGWTSLYIILMSLFCFWSLKFLLQLPKKTALCLVMSGILFLVGAIGLELFNRAAFQKFFDFSLDSTTAYIIALFEETFEIIAIFLFNLTLFFYVNKYVSLNSIALNTRFFIFTLFILILDVVITFFVTYA